MFIKRLEQTSSQTDRYSISLVYLLFNQKEKLMLKLGFSVKGKIDMSRCVELYWIGSIVWFGK